MESWKPEIMGIINVTDNSFYSQSRCLGTDGRPELDKILERAGRMLEEGASILDIGACSSRPGSTPVGEEEEWRRLETVLEAILTEFPGCTVSIDTWWASVAEKSAALFERVSPGSTEAGELIINDISAGEDDPRMLPAVGRLGLRYIAMHKRGTPANMQENTIYDDVTRSVTDYFRDFAVKAAKAGIEDWILDPGFGFSKTIVQNYELLQNLDRLAAPGLFDPSHQGRQRRILAGLSRKSMIYRLHGISPEEALPQTQVLNMVALQKGASILRVHDVAEAKRTLVTYLTLSHQGQEFFQKSGETI